MALSVLDVYASFINTLYDFCSANYPSVLGIIREELNAFNKSSDRMSAVFAESKIKFVVKSFERDKSLIVFTGDAEIASLVNPLITAIYDRIMKVLGDEKGEALFKFIIGRFEADNKDTLASSSIPFPDWLKKRFKKTILEENVEEFF